MPYQIIKSGTGYKVAKKTNKKKVFSKKPLTKAKAQAQMKAIKEKEYKKKKNNKK